MVYSTSSFMCSYIYFGFYFTFPSIAFHGFEMNTPIRMVGENNQSYSLKEEFLTHFLRKTVEDLQLIEEEGFFICLSTIDGIVKNDDWWYHSCKCHKAATFDEDSDTYYCTGCKANVCDVTP